jgi:hypothetical protein
MARCWSMASGEGQQRLQLLFHGQLVWSQIELCGRRKGGVGADGVVERPFIGSGRRGGSRSGGRAVASDGVLLQQFER